ncbi:MAG: hypothetical protein A2381_02645 [Bdellovibrionales bacterium RIFOXYB1_FULL_37_110]|nr:MAG: hypothetical protein A2181_05025 [Bdellovibrionales bacterium RIFOXYA1_FULL_38_20]OFZ52596.1 MAG: hypothetical protein A2417_00980 [Bdellovibrionales bacterium RIFOXYC1_FULL_37_79]OFZ58286.1 MAG: hypothetical protein A2381_02645 [Bdellovibrionales bacterium RIFOXYB1_FULL_37_110]OFZ65295.1 MAG: hypothetical protein A2577_04070 [Bdellovibrionales bacterium RIFOXYD1_FULL_36_51]
MNEFEECRTFVFDNDEDAKMATNEITQLPGVKAVMVKTKVSTIQSGTLTSQVCEISKKYGGKIKGFQLVWG